MTPIEFAELLNNRDYMCEITKQEEDLARQHGLLVVFGYSDDLVEFRGIVYEEVSAYNGTTLQINSEGVIPKWETIQAGISEQEAEEYFRVKALPHVGIRAQWCSKGGPPWKITAIDIDPSHFASFLIIDEGEPFCQGLVIDFKAATQ